MSTQVIKLGENTDQELGSFKGQVSEATGHMYDQNKPSLELSFDRNGSAMLLFRRKVFEHSPPSLYNLTPLLSTQVDVTVT